MYYHAQLSQVMKTLGCSRQDAIKIRKEAKQLDLSLAKYTNGCKTKILDAIGERLKCGHSYARNIFREAIKAGRPPLEYAESIPHQITESIPHQTDKFSAKMISKIAKQFKIAEDRALAIAQEAYDLSMSPYILAERISKSVPNRDVPAIQKILGCTEDEARDIHRTAVARGENPQERAQALLQEAKGNAEAMAQEQAALKACEEPTVKQTYDSVINRIMEHLDCSRTVAAQRYADMMQAGSSLHNYLKACDYGIIERAFNDSHTQAHLSQAALLGISAKDYVKRFGPVVQTFDVTLSVIPAFRGQYTAEMVEACLKKALSGMTIQVGAQEE